MEISDLSILSKALYSNKPFIEKTKSFPSFNANQELISKEYKFRTKKKGRKKKISLNIENQSTRATDPYEIVHNKFSKDNIRRRIKALFNNYIIRLLNNLIKQKYLNSRHYFLKMNIKVTKDLGIEYNRNLLNTPLKEIIVNISNKYQNKENNNIKCIKYIEEQKDNEEIINILNMTYEQLYINYLKTTKKDSQENSFEAHKEKMLKVYGKEYLDKFIENTKNFIEYFKKGKNRKSRKPPEVDIINIPLEFNKNNIIEDNKIEKIMVESFAQTDLCGINSKLIAFY
jgi:hypothetical protein